jgi:two-component system sensor histidine kinase/response regulator
MNVTRSTNPPDRARPDQRVVPAAPAIPNHVDILQAVIDATPDAIFVKDLEGRYLLVNTVTAGFLGKSPAEFVGKCDADLYGAETAHKYIEADREVLRSGKTQVFEDIATLGGVTHEYLVTKKVYRDQDGRIAGLLGISRDISARKRAEAATRKSAEYRNLFVLANDPIVIFEPDSQIVIDVNDKACEAYGFSREAFIGRSFKTLTQDVEHSEAQWARLLVEGAVPAFETVQYRADATPVAFLISASLIDYRGRKAVLSINRDITERKRIEAELEETRDAALESVRLKSEFLANMSHEIRTPMNGIIGMTDLTLDTKLTVKQREYLGMVKASADSLLGVVNDILDFSKIEAGKLRLEPIAFDLHDSVGDAMKTLALRAHEKGLELTFYVAPDVPAEVVGDPDRIRQILVNLVSNAIKFTDCGEVSVRVETAAAPPSGAGVHFSVTDTGIGIPREKQALIFEPFAQADGSITRQYGGTGLGLAITMQLIDLMDGRLWVESPVQVQGSEGGGPGSCFHFVMPLQSAPMADALPPVAAWPVHNLPVLIVDDNRTNRRILQEALFNWQMHATAVESGRAALDEMSRAAAAGRPFSLVLLDAHMPGMDGFTVADEIRRTPAIADATIMMLSSVGEHIYTEQLRPLRLAAYFTKPIKLSELRTAIQQLLEPGAAAERSRHQTGRAPAAPQGVCLRVLVVEDTFINQQLAIALLQKRGYTTELAVNGKEALVALEQREFDVVLMDVQMPEMNGLDATRRIREGEANGVRIPIIAMTAHAMKGDRERCIDAGMDAYVAKPIRADALWEAIDQLVPADGAAIGGNVGRRPPDAGAFDHAALLSCANGDLDLAHELADIFLATSPALLAEIRGAVARADRDTLERAAHSMKSAISYFANAAGMAAAARLEQMGCTGELTSADTVAATLEQNVKRLVAALGTFNKESAS